MGNIKWNRIKPFGCHSFTCQEVIITCPCILSRNPTNYENRSRDLISFLIISNTVGGTSTSFGQLSYLCPKKTERVRRSSDLYCSIRKNYQLAQKKWNGMFSGVKHGVPNTEESAGHKLISRHALAVSARSSGVGNSEIYALLLNIMVF